MKYKIPVTWKVRGYTEVEAATTNEALKKLYSNKKNWKDLKINQEEFIKGSFKVDTLAFYSEEEFDV